MDWFGLNDGLGHLEEFSLELHRIRSPHRLQYLNYLIAPCGSVLHGHAGGVMLIFGLPLSQSHSQPST